MQCIIYVRQTDELSLYTQFNECARYAKKYGYSIKGKVFDFTGNELHTAIDKVVFQDDVSSLIVYDKNIIGDFETALFYRIYLEKFNKKLLVCE